MPRPLIFLIFFTVVGLIVGGIHYYLWRRLVLDTGLEGPWRLAATITIIVLAVGVVATFPLGRVLPLGVARPVLFPFYFWMGLMVLFLFTFLGVDLVRGGTWVVQKTLRREATVADPARRRLLRRIVSGSAGGLVLAGGIGGAFWALGRLRVKKLEVKLPKLPAGLDGLTIVQITDLHLGPTRGRGFVEQVVQKINALEPDVVAITGDLADSTVAHLRDDVAPLGRIKARHGVFFVTGNHEYFTEPEKWLAELRRLGIRVLLNERVSIGDGALALDLAGVEDHDAPRFMPGRGPDVAKAVKGRDESRALVLLAHQPREIHEAARHGVGLQLSGHTHGGQIWPWHHFVGLQQGFLRGLYNHQGTWLYVSQGTGFWGPPIRVFSTAEITHVTLRSPARA